jgi:hypothetical protein
MTVSALSSMALLFAGAGTALAADGNETQLWVETGVRYRPKKKIRINLAQNLRLDQNVSRTESIMTDLAMSWSAEKWLRLAGGYRLNMDADSDGVFSPVHRLHIQSTMDRSIGTVSLSHRLRFEESFKVDGTELEQWHTLRNRIEAELDLGSSLTPVLSVELHSLLGEYRPVVQEKIRMNAGVSYKASKTNVYSLRYISQLPIQYVSDPAEHIVSLGYQYRIPKKRKEK